MTSANKNHEQLLDNMLKLLVEPEELLDETPGNFRRNRREAPVQCEICKKSYSNGRNLQRHIRNLHTKKNVKKPAIERKFISA